jgi:hypothetical protein
LWPGRIFRIGIMWEGEHLDMKTIWYWLRMPDLKRKRTQNALQSNETAQGTELTNGDSIINE